MLAVGRAAFPISGLLCLAIFKSSLVGKPEDQCGLASTIGHFFLKGGDRRINALVQPFDRGVWLQCIEAGFAEKNLSMAKLLAELREPRGGGKECIPWLGEAEAKDSTLAVCAAGQIAIHVRGLKTLQLVPGETGEMALRRMKRDFDVTGKELENTTLAKPGTAPSSSGAGPVAPTSPGTPGLPGIPTVPGVPPAPGAPGAGDPPLNPFGGPGTPTPGAGGDTGGGGPAPTTTKLTADPTSGLNLLSRVVDTWHVGPATTVRNVTIRVDKLTGAQLQQLIQNLPNGLLFGLDADKEDA